MKSQFLISSYSTNNYHDISIIDYDNGKLSLTDKNILQGNNPSYLKYDNGHIYSISETDEPTLFCYDLNLENVFIKKIKGKYPCHIETFDNYIFISNYGSGDVVVFDKKKESFIETIKLTDHSHAHSSIVINDKLLIADLGADCIWAIYKTAKVQIHIEGGPRQIIPYNEGIYTIEENANTVTQFDKKLNVINKCKTLSNNIASFAGGASLLTDETLLIANRGANTITHLSPELTILNEFDCYGDWPRYIHVIENDSVVLVCNQRSGELISLDYKTGELIDRLSYPGISYCTIVSKA